MISNSYIKTNTCVICKNPVKIIDRFVINDLVVHKNCLKCEHCQLQLYPTSVVIKDGKFYCEQHGKKSETLQNTNTTSKKTIQYNNKKQNFPHKVLRSLTLNKRAIKKQVEKGKINEQKSLNSPTKTTKEIKFPSPDPSKKFKRRSLKLKVARKSPNNSESRPHEDPGKQQFSPRTDKMQLKIPKEKRNKNKNLKVSFSEKNIENPEPKTPDSKQIEAHVKTKKIGQYFPKPKTKPKTKIKQNLDQNDSLSNSANKPEVPQTYPSLKNQEKNIPIINTSINVNNSDNDNDKVKTSVHSTLISVNQKLSEEIENLLNKNEKLKENAQNLEEQNELLKTSQENSNKKQNELENEVLILKEEIDKLKQNQENIENLNKKLELENQSLLNQAKISSDLIEANKNLVIEIEKLLKENEIFREEKDQLKKQIEELNQNSKSEKHIQLDSIQQTLIEENRRLISKIEESQNQLQTSSTENSILKRVNENYEKEISSLKRKIAEVESGFISKSNYRK
ncbi:mical-like 1a-related [Anaeramoeba ignava]|uniref:Mical-like 1a-related n=1 Tax=Anaeramoeba ignava TaxID=1746090 RepID=A0A9Q0L8I2_ANAIG|nr:mical-like 1a-related [Anaeramoeba ignava]